MTISFRKLLRAIYRRLYRLLPQRAQVITSQLVFYLSRKPARYYDPKFHPKKGLQRGVVTFSVDFEMAWAWQYAKGLEKDAVMIGLREREQMPQILAKLNQYTLPSTWATVGHLFLDRCDCGTTGRAHPEILRPAHFESNYIKFTTGDWYQHDPCSNVYADPAWYAPDLIEMILNSETKHEIASHSFSHISFASCSPEVAAAEIDACLEAMKPYGLRPRTWVFPTNEVGNLAVLADKGFENIRSFPEPWAKISLPVRRDDGMWAVHDSSGIELGGGPWNSEERLARLKSLVNEASASKMAAHFWFHPSMPPEQMQTLLFPLLRHVAEQRDRGLIDVLTMEQLVRATKDALRLA